MQDDNSTFTYPVVIALTRTATKIPSGADTQIQINVGSADQALVVPTSAVHTTGTNSYVLVDPTAPQASRRSRSASSATCTAKSRPA